MINRAMETGWRPQTNTYPLLEMWKFFAQFSAAPSFYSLSYKADRIFRGAFYKEMDMAHIHHPVNDFDFYLFTYLTDNPLYRERDRLLDQNLPAICRREDYSQSIMKLHVDPDRVPCAPCTEQ
jgi:hypothetical protein